jgi:hypothetical protein
MKRSLLTENQNSFTISLDPFDQSGEITGRALVIADLLSDLRDEETPRRPDQIFGFSN